MKKSTFLRGFSILTMVLCLVVAGASFSSGETEIEGGMYYGCLGDGQWVSMTISASVIQGIRIHTDWDGNEELTTYWPNEGPAFAIDNGTWGTVYDVQPGDTYTTVEGLFTSAYETTFFAVRYSNYEAENGWSSTQATSLERYCTIEGYTSQDDFGSVTTVPANAGDLYDCPGHEVYNDRYPVGAEAILTATPNDGYEFSYWENNNSKEKFYDNPLTLEVSRQALGGGGQVASIRAYFSPAVPSVTAASGPYNPDNESAAIESTGTTAVTVNQLKLTAGSVDNITVKSLSYTDASTGITAAINAVLYRDTDCDGDGDVRLGTAQVQNSRVEFTGLNETISAELGQCYLLQYEITPDMLQGGEKVGAQISPSGVTAADSTGKEVYASGETVEGNVNLGAGKLYVVSFEVSKPIELFGAIEPSTSTWITGGLFIAQNCLLTGREDFSRLNVFGGERFLTTFTNLPSGGQIIEIYSEYGNQPDVRFTYCGEGFSQPETMSLAAPVELNGCTLDDIEQCTIERTVTDPYHDCTLKFSGSVKVSIRAPDTVSRWDIMRTIVRPLRQSNRWNAVDVVYEGNRFANGFITATLRIVTSLCVDTVAAEFPGSPDIESAEGRKLELWYYEDAF